MRKAEPSVCVCGWQWKVFVCEVGMGKEKVYWQAFECEVGMKCELKCEILENAHWKCELKCEILKIRIGNAN
jgi:hypothetical protein